MVLHYGVVLYGDSVTGPIVGPDSESAIADMQVAAGRCDILELRLDRIRDADLPPEA